MMEPEVIQEKIQDSIPSANVEVMDLTGTRDHFRVVVVSEEFEGLNMVQQHQKVYGALGDSLEGEEAPIHALGLKTFTPEEWEDFSEENSL